MSGKFITFEGLEGAGKSTQARQARDWLEMKAPGQAVLTREPGGTKTGEAIRGLLLRDARLRMDGVTEALLLFAARRQHVQEVLAPALKAGKIVLCDRFTDATFAYQGGGRGMDRRLLERLQDLALGELRPDLTLLLDLPEELGLARLRSRENPKDRFETETRAFFRRVREAYLEQAARFPGRIRVIDAAKPAAEVEREVRGALLAAGVG